MRENTRVARQVSKVRYGLYPSASQPSKGSRAYGRQNAKGVV